ncbi:MAG: DNA-directed DNA polymerase I [Candidatus Bathyarchaeia archaeon]
MSASLYAFLKGKEDRETQDTSPESYAEPRESSSQAKPGEGKGEGAKQSPKPEGSISLNLARAYVLSVAYDGEGKRAFLKLYNEADHRIYLWFDDSGHKPYCLSDLTPKELEAISALVKHPGFIGFEVVKKYDALADQERTMTKIVASDPLAIGGRPTGCIRDIIPKAWEADIKYHECYIFDRDIAVGMPYKIEDGKLVKIDFKPPPEVEKSIESLFKDEGEEFRDLARRWVELLECPVPSFRRAALDIEVTSPVPTRVPNPREAKEPIVAVAFSASDGWRRILLLRRSNVKAPLPRSIRMPGLPEAEVEAFESEADLIRRTFQIIEDYPIILTFNGDDFDLSYLYHRALNLGFDRKDIPIVMGRESASLRRGIHLDLYKFFFNRSIQVYAFGQKYREVTLDDVGASLLGVGKMELEKPIPELDYESLATYCLQDADITLSLTTMDEDLIMKLIIVLARISHTTIEDLSRQGVSTWLRNMLSYEHRRRGWLIPRSEDLLEAKGFTATKAIIEGKKYRGAEVIEPEPGAHFNVSVLDFQSMYPSIIRRYNLSYETVRCPHPECRKNAIPGTPHWVCGRRRGISSLVIGSLRDLRVRWYKSRAKEKGLPKALANWYGIISNSLKVVLNAAYGVFGAESFFLYCPPVAEATASIGRYAITETIKQAQAIGMRVVYGDTDSIFLKAPETSKIEKLMDWSEERLGMELDIDKVYRYAVFSSRKKNYLGVFQDGSVDIKGLTGKKRNTPLFLQKAFFDMIRILSEVQSAEEFDEAKERITELVKTCYTKLKNRQYSLEELAFNIMMSRTIEGYVKTKPQHIKAAELLAQRGIEVTAGDIISFVKVVGPTGVKPVQLANIKEIDVEKYVGYVESTFQQVLDALDIDLKEVLGATRLEFFMPG